MPRGRPKGSIVPDAKSRIGTVVTLRVTQAQRAEIERRRQTAGPNKTPLSVTAYVIKRCCEDPE